MQSSFSSERSLYTSIVNYIRTLRDEPNSLDGVHFAGYTDNADAEYIENIRKYFVEKRYRNDFPKEIGNPSIIRSKYNFTPMLNIKDSTGFYSSCYNSSGGDDFSHVCAWALAYITAGNRNSVVNKERYLHRTFSAIHDYEKQKNVRFSSEDMLLALHRTNRCMGLFESYLFRSNGDLYLLMESELMGQTGLSQKSYVIVNSKSFANVIFGPKDGVRESYPIVSQIDLSIEDTQRFVNGELTKAYNYKPSEIDEVKRFMFSKFGEADKNDPPEIKFEDAHGNSTPNTFANDYCFTVHSPVKVMTK